MTTLSYRPEIDGLRAVAVLPVILFHAGFSVFSGGFVGVDVFFVISGYLITSILISEMGQGNFSILKFYERRARRILPALFVVMLACIPFAWMWMLPQQLKDFSESLVAVVFFSSNLLFWSEPSGYFAGPAELKPLLHTWSLAVEEQYYLLFPFFLLLFWRFGRNWLLAIIMLLALGSLALSEWGWRNDPSANFYLAPSRAWELLAGSICAFLTHGRDQRSSNVLSLAGLALILFSIFQYDEHTPFPSVYALAPVGGTALIILFAARGTWVARILSTAPFVGIGLISYSAYLWHQPLFAFARLRSFYQEPSPALMMLLAAASLFLAWLTWMWVETPFRKKLFLPVSQRSMLGASGLVASAFISIGLTGHLTDGFEGRHVDSPIAQLEERVIVNHGLSTDCEGDFNRSPNCRTSENPNVLLWGDSFAMHLAQGILASEPAVRLQQHTTSKCSPIVGLASLNGPNSEAARRCLDFNDSVLDWIGSQKVDLVIMSSPFGWSDADQILTRSGTSAPGNPFEIRKKMLLETVDAVRSTGARVVIVSPTPSGGSDTGSCLFRSVFFGKDPTLCNFQLDTDTTPYALLRSVSDTVPVYWLHDDICSGGVCHAMQDGVFIYRDGGHLAKEGSALLGKRHDWMDAFFRMAE